MKNKKINIKKSWLFSTVIVSVLMLLCVSSCTKEFLKEEPPGKITDDLLANEEGVDKLLTGAYAAIAGCPLSCYDCMYGGTDQRMWGSIRADDANTGSAKGDHAEMWIFELFEGQPDNRSLWRKWYQNYDGISSANKVLEMINRIPDVIPVEKETSMKAEARFIRAWLHYNLYIVFKYVPYITRNLENPVSNMPYTEEQMDEPAKVPNMTPDDNEIDLWPLIEGDLKYCVENLPVEQEQIGRIDKWAAKVVLTRVYLMQGKEAEAEILINDIIDNSGAELVSNFYWNFDIEHGNNIESLFEFQSGSRPTGKRNSTSFCTARGLHPQHMGGWGHYKISLQTVNAFQVDPQGLPLDDWRHHPFKNSYGVQSAVEYIPSEEPVDPRLDWTVGRRGIPFLDWGIHQGVEWCRAADFGGVFHSLKHQYYRNSSRPSAMSPGPSTINNRKFRLAHVYLWKAEIEANKGNFEVAREYINKLRERAKDPVVMGKCYTYKFVGGDDDVHWDEPAANYHIGLYPPGSFNTKEEAWEAIRTETLLETAGFGLRFFDLLRWDEYTDFDMVDWMNDYMYNDSQYRPLLGGASFQERDKYVILPQAPIDNQPGVIKQNPDFR